MARKTKLILNEDDFYEFEVFRNDGGRVGISIGVHDLQTKESKRDEHIMSFNNEDIDLLIDALIDLRYE